MTIDIGDLDKIDEALMTYDLSDEALEAAARVDGRLAITIGYCATASSALVLLAVLSSAIRNSNSADESDATRSAR